jgi:cardiolipin synthase
MRTAHVILLVLFVAAELLVIGRALLRPHREPMSRLAWIIVILVAPGVGVIAYLLLGEARVSLRRWRRGKENDAKLPRPPIDDAAVRTVRGDPYGAALALAATVNRLAPTRGNDARLAADSNVAIDEMCADIGAAGQTIHAAFYIWLDDHNGLKVKDALLRAARRGVAVRVLADAVGSRALIRSRHWRDLSDGGVETRVSLPVGNLLMSMIRGRVDVRNHRKLLIVDNRIAWCGSQNTADPEFRIKPRYAPWVDVMTRWSGPVARDFQLLFVEDWMAEGGEDLGGLLTAPADAERGAIVAQVLGTGPTLRFDAMPTTFAELIHSAREELVVTTPYFVPDEQILYALTSAARRGVRTILAIPKRNDSRIVQAVARSYYADLLEAGVEVMEYRCGLLHAKTMIVDRTAGLIGSANLDRRSFELNFECNVLFVDPAFAAVMRRRQDDYLADCDRVTMEVVEGFTLPRRLVQNLLAMMSPLL